MFIYNFKRVIRDHYMVKPYDKSKLRTIGSEVSLNNIQVSEIERRRTADIKFTFIENQLDTALITIVAEILSFNRPLF
jgi:hypothetical protein